MFFDLRLVLVLYIFFSTFYIAHGQLHYSEKKRLIYLNDDAVALSNDTLRVLLPRKNTPVNEDYKKIITDNWKFSPITFISDTMVTTKKPGFFFHYYGKKYSHTWNTTSVSGGRSTITTEHTYINYQISRIYQQTEEGKIDTFKITVVSFPLYPNYDALYDPSLLDTEDFSFGGMIRNWSPGFLKNYLQDRQYLLQMSLNPTKDLQFYNDNKHPDLYKLATETLFVPDYSFIRFNSFNGNEKKRWKEKKIFKKYDFAYATISMEDLSNKILNAQEPFYYLRYVKISNYTFTEIVNGLTGNQLIYFNDNGSRNLKKKVLKKFSKKIRAAVNRKKAKS